MDIFGEGPRIRLERKLGDGASGQTFRFCETTEDGRQRRFAFKIPNEYAIDDMRNEIYWLNVG